MSKCKFFTQLNPQPSKGVTFDLPSLVQSQFKDDCDISNMIRRALTGDATVFHSVHYADVLNAPDGFHDAANKTAVARTIWEEIPEQVKATFGSPEALISAFDAFLASKDNKDNQIKTPSEGDTKPSDGATSSTSGESVPTT